MATSSSQSELLLRVIVMVLVGLIGIPGVYLVVTSVKAVELIQMNPILASVYGFGFLFAVIIFVRTLRIVFGG